MKKTLRLLPIVSLAFAAACGGGRAALRGPGGRPAWVEGESPKWPRSQYVVGMGSADDEQTADERARGEISRVFNADVNVHTTSDETETTQKKDGATSTSFSQLVNEKVQTASRKLLEGSEIVERWTDPATSRRYSLATLSKAKALQAVDEKEQALDSEAARWKASLDQASEKFEKAKAAAKLAALLRGRTALENDRRVLGGGSAPSAIDAGAAREAASRALAALDVVVAASGDGEEQLETGIVSGLAAAGLSAKRGSATDASDLMVEAQAAVQAIAPAGGDERWKWARATAVVTLKDGRAGKSFARFEPNDREASADAGEARRRALAGLAKKAADSVSAAIAEFFENR